MLEIIHDLRKQHMKKNDNATLYYTMAKYPIRTCIKNLYIYCKQSNHLKNMIKTMTQL